MDRPEYDYVDLWDEGGLNSATRVFDKDKEILLVVSDKKIALSSATSDSWNPDYYLHVLSSSGHIGWIHSQNVEAV